MAEFSFLELVRNCSHALASGGVEVVEEALGEWNAREGRYTLNSVFFNTTDVTGRSLLHYACAVGSPELVRILIKLGADMAAKTLNGVTPLMQAALEGQESIVHLMLAEFQCPITRNERNGKTLLHYACQGDVNLVLTLILEHKANINACDDQNNTPLHVATFSGNIEVVLCLINVIWL